jgi:ApaG protein
MHRMSGAVTRGIRIEVEAAFLPERSEPEANYFFFGYTVRISNEGDTAAQLLSRHWIITDGNGEQEEVIGPGVVGAQPRLEPGQSFQYSSFCPLRTPFGTMHGTYTMVTDTGERFEAEIAPFTLATPHTVN